MSDQDNGSAGGTFGTEGAAPAWMSQLPDGMKEDADLSGFNTIGDLATAFKENKGVQNEIESYKSRAYVPGEGATEEEIKAYREAIGVPESYDFEGKTLADSLEVKGEIADVLQDSFKNQGLTKTQADGVVEAISKIFSNVGETGMRVHSEDGQKAEQYFRQQWGGQYDDRKAGVHKTLLRYGGQDLVAELNKTGFGNNQGLIAFVDNVNQLIGDHNNIEGGNEGTTGQQTAVGIRYPSMKGM